MYKELTSWFRWEYFILELAAALHLNFRKCVQLGLSSDDWAMMMRETFWRNKMPSLKIRRIPINITIAYFKGEHFNTDAQATQKYKGVRWSLSLLRMPSLFFLFFWVQRDPLTVRKLCPFLMPPMQADYFQWLSFLNDKGIFLFFQRKKYRILTKLGKCQLEDHKFNTPADSPQISRNVVLKVFPNLQNF